MFEMAKSLLAQYASGTCPPSSMEMLVNQKCLLEVKSALSESHSISVCMSYPAQLHSNFKLKIFFEDLTIPLVLWNVSS